MALSTYSSPIEDAMIDKAINNSVPWDQLPKRVKLFLGTNDEYIRRIRLFCIKARLRWSDSPAKNICREADYYDEMIKYLRKSQSLFPYHLADYICRMMRLSPFKYYCDLLLDIMKQERSYDTIPNFTAADALRETGIGRNQFIEIMNKSRSKLMWRVNRGIVKDMFPADPVEFLLEPWWLVCSVNLSTDEYRKLTDEELTVVERGGRVGDCLVGEFDEEVVRGLYARGLIYFDVPVYPKDRFRVSSLEGFVSNRNQQHEDSAEQLLYALFVTSSEQATVEEMAATLQADVTHLASAISLACRLGWAEKVLDMGTVLDQMPSLTHATAFDGASVSGVSSSSSSIFDSDFRGFAGGGGDGGGWSGEGSILAGSSLAGSFSAAGDSAGAQSFASLGAGGGGGVGSGIGGGGGGAIVVDRLRIALMVDANLTSFLMMGSFSYELKQQAVTLYEAGKLGERSVAELCGELRAVEKTQLEGELQKFTEHAFSLRCALSCLRTSTLDSVLATTTSSGGSRSGGGGNADSGFGGDDDASAVDAASSVAGSGGSDARFEPDRSGEGGARDGAAPDADSSSAEASAAHSSREGSDGSRGLQEEQTSKSEGEDGLGGGGGGGGVAQNPVGRVTFNRVEMLRCESLAGLSPATLQRLLQRDYNVIVSIVPLPKPLSITPSVTPAHGSGPMGGAHGGPPHPQASPVHFGPPAPAFLTPWAKLLLYTLCCAGPVSVVLMRGLRLRLLPPPLAGCAKALLWTWDGMSVGGIGGQIEGSLVPGSVLLHSLNSLLRHSAVLVQPLQRGSASLDSVTGEPEVRCVALPLRNSRSLIGEEKLSFHSTAAAGTAGAAAGAGGGNLTGSGGVGVHGVGRDGYGGTARAVGNRSLVNKSSSAVERMSKVKVGGSGSPLRGTAGADGSSGSPNRRGRLSVKVEPDSSPIAGQQLQASYVSRTPPPRPPPSFPSESPTPCSGFSQSGDVPAATAAAAAAAAAVGDGSGGGAEAREDPAEHANGSAPSEPVQEQPQQQSCPGEDESTGRGRTDPSMSSKATSELGPTSPPTIKLSGARQFAAASSSFRSEGEDMGEAALKVVQELGLHIVGFLRLMQVDSEEQQQRVSKGAGVEHWHGQSRQSRSQQGKGSGTDISPPPRWVPHSLEFGMPLFDSRLCREVCESIVCEAMLTRPELAAQQAATQVLRSSLRDFIHDYREKGPVERAVASRNASLLRITSRRWSKLEDRPAYEVVTPRKAVEPLKADAAPTAGVPATVAAAVIGAGNVVGGAGSGVPSGPRGREGMKRPSAFLSRRLSRNYSEFWFLSENSSTQTQGSVRAYSSDEVESSTNDTHDAGGGGGGFGGDSDPESCLSSVVLPGVNLLFDGHILLPLDLTAFLQGRLAASLAADATLAAQRRARQW